MRGHGRGLGGQTVAHAIARSGRLARSNEPKSRSAISACFIYFLATCDTRGFTVADRPVPVLEC